MSLSHEMTNTPGTDALVSIVVGTYNRRDQIERAIDSVVRETRTPFRLYITDAGSTDGTVEYLQSVASDRIIPILTGQRLGQARAYNDVFEKVDTPYVCWLSDDNEIVAAGIDKAVQILAKDPRIGMVGLKVRDLLGPFVAAPYIGGLSAYGILNVNQGVLPSRVMRQVGFFSEKFRDYGIDPDLTAKVLLAGYDIVYTRDVAVHHYRNWEVDRTSPEYAKMRERQEKYLKLYAETYADRFSGDPFWAVRLAIWKVIRRMLGPSIDSKRKVLGLYARDWQNCIAGRFISLRRELGSSDELAHLRQTAPNPVRSPPLAVISPSSKEASPT